MVVYQCIVAEANTAAFVLDGSSLSNLQVCCNKRSQQSACTVLCVYCTTIVPLIDTFPCMHCNTEAMIWLSSKLLSSCCYTYIMHTLLNIRSLNTSKPNPPSRHDPPSPSRAHTDPHAPDSAQT